MEFTIKRKYVSGLAGWLQKQNLGAAQSRERSKFIELLAEEATGIEAVRMDLLKKYAKLDEKGEPEIIKKDDTDHYDIPEAEMVNFTKEMNEYLEGDFTCGGPGLKNRLTVLKEVVLNTPGSIDPNIAPSYDKWCDAFEAMKTDTE